MEILINILIIVGIFGGMALIFGTALVIAGHFFAVKTDERVDAITALLPGANCSGCGHSGCSAYAAAIVNGEAKTNLCALSSDETIEKISAIMGVKAEKTLRMRAQVMCSGTGKFTTDKYKYEGIQDCLFASKIGGGEKDCAYGCIGMGTCVKACPAGAIKVENGVAVVEYEKCKGCGICVDSCPKGIIKLVPFDAKYWVGCRSKDKGQQVRKYCDVGCISCGICVKNCPSGAIQIVDDVAQIDYTLCSGCGVCFEKCPRHIIWSGELQIRKGDTLEDARKIKYSVRAAALESTDKNVSDIHPADKSATVVEKAHDEVNEAIAQGLRPSSGLSFDAKEDKKD